MLVTFTGEVINIGEQMELGKGTSRVHRRDVILRLFDCNGTEMKKEYFRTVNFINEALRFLLYIHKGDIIRVHVIPLGYVQVNDLGEYVLTNSDMVKLMDMIEPKKKKPKISKFCDLSQYVEQEPIPDDFNNNNRV